MRTYVRWKFFKKFFSSSSVIGRRINLSFILLFAWTFSLNAQIITSEEHLPDTKILSSDEIDGFRLKLLNEVRSYFEQEIKSSPLNRDTMWHRNYGSILEYLKSISPNRERFQRVTGVIDKRCGTDELIYEETTLRKAQIAQTDAYIIYRVHWPVFDDITGDGLLIEPRSKVLAQIVAIPDADWTPEMLTGLSPGVPSEAQFAGKLAAAGCRVIVPVLINRENTWSGNPNVCMTNEPHREFIYRRAYEVGRHIIGYEIQKVLALVDWFTKQNLTNNTNLPIAVAGYGEGGLIAFYSTAIDQRIKGALVSGYFQEREEIWKEPIYRNVWGLLNEFGDAEIAGLIAPRNLVIEACKGPELNGPPVANKNQSDVAAPGRLITPPLQSVLHEADRTKEIYEKLQVSDNFKVVVNSEGLGLPGSKNALQLFLDGIGVREEIREFWKNHLEARRMGFNEDDRMHNQITELMRHLDKTIDQCNVEREKFWNKADYSSIQKWTESIKPYREYFWKENMGKMPSPSIPLNPSTRLIYNTPKWKGYWVKLDVWPNIMTGGILLIPQGLKPGEKRPVIVCEHGLGGKPEVLVDHNIKSVYHSFGAQLADKGYIVFAPQHIYGLMPDQPYGKFEFREIQRMVNPLKKSLYSIVTGQEEQFLKWLKQLPFVDSLHIGLYGLSYGGKTAMRVPAVLKDYSVVICSGDFNQWIWKNTSLDFKQSYMFLPEYDMYEFNLGNTFNYAEMAGLIAPRPFMVERGHGDAVAPDEWVGYEYSKVQRLYDLLGIGYHTAIEYFNGPHEIHGIKTFQFLDKYLKQTNENSY